MTLWPKSRITWLGLFLAGIILIANPSPSVGNEAKVNALGCGACHRFAQDASEEKMIGPDLFYAGSKYQKVWLIEFLQDPETIRKSGHPRDPGYLKGAPEFQPPHPKVKGKEAESVANYLMSLTLPNLPEVTLSDETLSKGERARIKMMFDRNLGCIACHESLNLVGMPRGGISGPSLLNAGNRLKASWVYLWLKQPDLFKNKSRMPVFQLDETVLSQMTSYILSHKKDGLKK